jgi:hypothetical protein
VYGGKTTSTIYAIALPRDYVNVMCVGATVRFTITLAVTTLA